MGIRTLEKILQYCCCCWVAKPCLTLYDFMNCSTPGFSVLHYLNAMILGFLIFSLKLALSLSFTIIKRILYPSSLSAIRVVLSAYLRLLMFLPPILIPACNLSSPAFLMMCSACRLNKQSDSRQPCGITFSILNQSVVPYRIPPVASWPTYRFLRRKVRWSDIPISLRVFHSFVMIHTVKGFSIVKD